MSRQGCWETRRPAAANQEVAVWSWESEVWKDKLETLPTTSSATPDSLLRSDSHHCTHWMQQHPNTTRLQHRRHRAVLSPIQHSTSVRLSSAVAALATL